VTVRDKNPVSGATPQLQAAIDSLLKAVGPLEFGSIELTFHQGRLVQFEKREKTRLAAKQG
jgi:hypothetical protein